MAFTTIDDPSQYFTITLWTGNATDDRAITNSANAGDFQPDWIWYKERDGTSEHRVFDSSRGASKRLEPNNTNAEATDTSNHKSFDSNGFTIGTSGSTNENGKTYVAWQWKANGGSTTSFNESGSNPGGTHQANTTAGFSIVTYTGTGSNGTVQHGLSSAPELVIVKQRDDAAHDWQTGSDELSSWAYRLKLNDNVSQASVATSFNSTAPTSSVFTVGSNDDVNEDAHGYVGYCFHSVQGYCKVGAWKGNGSANGPYIYTGFRPKWILHKDLGSTEQWQIKDTTRYPNNPNYYPIYANLSNVEGNNTNSSVDFLSNGFKIRTSDGSHNTSGNTYLYYAIAEQPWCSSKGVPSNAR